MRKIIDLPDATIVALKIHAKKKGWNVKQLIEYLLVIQATKFDTKK